MFRREEGAGPMRRRRQRTTRQRQITFKVSVLRDSSITHYRSHHDSTPACRVVVNYDLNALDFFQALRENIPGLPSDFDLCRVNGRREVLRIEQNCPRAIHLNNALGRSNLYILPKISAASEQQPLDVVAVADQNPQPVGEIEHRTPNLGVDRDEFYVQEDMEDMEDMEDTPIESPEEDEVNAEIELATVLSDFRASNLDEDTSFSVIARRKFILKSAVMALAKNYFAWHKVPNIEFIGEMAGDYGGPRREFFRLLMIDLQTSMGIFEGQPGNLLFSYSQEMLENKKYYAAGKMCAWSIMHNGPGPRCFNRQLYFLMCGQKPELDVESCEVFLDPDLKSKIQKVSNCSTPQDLEEIRETMGDWIEGCGVPRIYSATLDGMSQIGQELVAHFIFHRVASVVQQFQDGMDSCGHFWQMVKRFWRQFLPVFTNTGEKLKRNSFQSLFTVAWSPPGSNRRDAEEETIFLWEWWLMAIQEQEVDLTFEEVLIFVTGADRLPPLGFSQGCIVEFYDQEEGARRLPYASTCSMSLFLPRGVKEEKDFESLMDTALRGSLGFGKV